MADVTNRDAKEALISKPLSKEFSRFRIQLLSIIPGMDPWMMDIAPEFWVEHQAGLTAAISPVISGIYIAQAETMLDDFEIFGVDWGLANADAVTFAKDYTFELVTDLTETSRKTLRRVIPAFFEDGWTQGQLSDSLSSTFGTMRASMIARTEVTRAASMGELQVSKYLAEQGIIMKHIWHTRNDELVCTLCGPKDEKEIGVEIEFGYPPEHPRCLPGDSLVLPIGRVTAGSERWYEGDVVTIVTLENKLTVTPNHPILTLSGWKKAGECIEGGHVFGSAFGKGASPLIEVNNEHPVTSIQDIFGSLDVNGLRVPTAAPDFHGDGGQSEVAIIRPNSEVVNRVETAFTQPIAQDDFLRGDVVSQGTFPTLCPHGKLFYTDGPTTGGLVSGLDLVRFLLGSHTAPFGDFGLGLVPGIDASIDQPITEGPPADTGLFSESILGLAGNVTLQEIVKIRYSNFVGHVYNLQTESGLYVADGIITHNCRCWWGQVLAPL